MLIIVGIAETVSTLKDAGIKPIIITTLNILFAECFKDKHGFDAVIGTLIAVAIVVIIVIISNVKFTKNILERR